MFHPTSDLTYLYPLVLLTMWWSLREERAPLPRYVAALAAAGIVVVLLAIVASLTKPLWGWIARLVWGLQILCNLLLGIAAAYIGGKYLAAWNGAQAVSHQRGTVLHRLQSLPSRARPLLHALPLLALLLVSMGIAPEAVTTGPEPPPPAVITLAGLALTREDETKHFKLIGTTGTGKSTAIRELITGARARGDRAVIADPDGSYLRQFYDPSRGDVILNPFRADSCAWSLFAEIKAGSLKDIEHVLQSLIPDPEDAASRDWHALARTFLGQLITQCIDKGALDHATLLRMLHSATLPDLQQMLSGSAAETFVAKDNERMFGSIRAVASQALAALKHAAVQQGEPFGVRDWVRHGPPGGVLFIPYMADEIPALKTLIAAWVRLVIFELLVLPEEDHRMWIVVDELDALGPIDGLKDALPRLRKHGGRCVLGFQSIGQVFATYGRGVGDTIVENCGNSLILRCSASERGGTAQYASGLIGQREVIRTTRSRTYRLWDGLLPLSRSKSEHYAIEPAVLPSEIEQLPDLAGFCKRASDPSWREVRLTHVPPAVRDTPVPVSVPDEPSPAVPTEDAPVDLPAPVPPAPSRRRASRKKPAAPDNGAAVPADEAPPAEGAGLPAAPAPAGPSEESSRAAPSAPVDDIKPSQEP